MALVSVAVYLHADEATPAAQVRTVESGERFISLQVATDISIALAGFDAVAAAHARAFAAALLAAADQLDPIAVEQRPASDTSEVL